MGVVIGGALFGFTSVIKAQFPRTYQEVTDKQQSITFTFSRRIIGNTHALGRVW